MSPTRSLGSGGGGGGAGGVSGGAGSPIGNAFAQAGWAALCDRSRGGDGSSRRCVSLLASAFEGWPPVLLFPLPPWADPSGEAARRRSSRILGSAEAEAVCGSVPKMYFSHGKENHEYNALLNSMKLAGVARCAPTASRKWCVFWGGAIKTDFLRRLNPFQMVNHFPGSWQLGRKDSMWRNVRKLQRSHPDRVRIAPTSFVLPEDWYTWETARKHQPAALWIYKPANSSCGRGIRLLRSKLDAQEEKLLERKSGVVQRYIDRPMLINGFKFDMRLYVVVTSFDPLRVYLNAEGLVRLATEKYDPCPSSLKLRTMHLTNYSVNKHADSYVKNLDGPGAAPSGGGSVGADEEDDEGEDLVAEESVMGGAADSDSDQDGSSDGGEDEDDEEPCSPTSPAAASTASGPGGGDGPSSSKWSMEQLREHLLARGIDYELMMARVKDLIIKTLISVEPAIVSMWQAGANFVAALAAPGLRGLGANQNCFEIYGFDVLVDESLQPWLLEVNTAPSLSSSSPFDKRVKTQLVADVLTLVGIRPFDHRLVSQAVKEERRNHREGFAPKAKGMPKSHTVQSVPRSSLRDFGEAEWTTIVDAHDEYLRRGAFERIFPTKSSGRVYGDLFPMPRYANMVLARWLEEGGEACFAGVDRLASLGGGSPTSGGAATAPSWVPRLLCKEAC